MSRYFRHMASAFRFLIAAVITLTAVSGSFPVSANFSDMPVSSYYASVLYNNTNGLPTSEANSVAADGDGAIWIGGYGGLVRYDGSHFERMDSTTGLSSIVSLFFDSRNRMWVGTNDSGAAVMIGDKLKKFNREDGLSSLSVRSIAEDSNGTIYIATTQGIAAVDNDLILRRIDAPQINEEYIRDIKTGCDGVIYGVTMSGAVFTLENGALSGYYSNNMLGISTVRAILPDPNAADYVYIATTSNYLTHIRLSDPQNKEVMIHTAPLNYINDIAMFGDTLWLCADDGIGYLEDNAITKLKDCPLTTSIEGMIEDYQGNLWFASSQQGVMKIVSNHFADLYQHYPRLKNVEDVVYATCLYHDMLFIGTKTNGLRVLTASEEVLSLPVEKVCCAAGSIAENTDLLTFFSETRIRSIVRDSQDRLWFSTYGDTALMRYDGKTLFRFNQRDGLPSDRIRTVVECKDGSFLVAGTGGLAVIKDDKVTKVYHEDDGIGNVEILTAVEAENGDYILGTDGGGIYVIHEGIVSHYGLESGLESEVVMRIKKNTKRNIYWIITSNSIAYMDENNTIRTVHGFPYSNNFDIYENSRDELWVLSSNGIYVAKAEDLLKNGEIKTDYYGRENGLLHIATANSYSELTAEGNLYIASSTGVTKVNIEKPLDEFKDVNLSVPYIEVDGEMVYPDEDGVMQIPSSARKITIHAFAYNYSLISPYITYYLDGFDSIETTVKQGDLQPVDYTNLSGGDYEFVMELMDSQNNVIKTLKIPINKEKAIYEMLWVHLLAFGLVFGVIILFMILYLRHRTAVYRRREQEQRELLNEIVEAFSKVIDIKDKYTNGHSARVAKYTMMLTKELGYDEETVQRFYCIALLHDIGKIGVPMDVLNKPGKLTDEEYAVIKSHSENGYEILKDISLLPELSIGAGAHHERPDGKGYPKGLRGDEIPRVAQIIAVADTFDAMYSNRPYRKRMNFEKAVSIIKDVSGTQLTSDVVDAFLKLVEQGEFRAPDDQGGGTVEDIDNIHGKQRQNNGESPQNSTAS
ncbi:MAG: HD domain-containing protein [Oscillospiraceae bacterium]|nr:HD domain-containing protein [Oscillospiraceae bacterium]